MTDTPNTETEARADVNKPTDGETIDFLKAVLYDIYQRCSNMGAPVDTEACSYYAHACDDAGRMAGDALSRMYPDTETDQ